MFTIQFTHFCFNVVTMLNDKLLEKHTCALLEAFCVGVHLFKDLHTEDRGAKRGANPHF